MGENRLLDCGFWLNTDEEQVRAVLEQGADIMAVDEFGRTPLHLAAAYSDNPAAIGVLLEGGANIRATTGYGATPLHLAAAHSFHDAIIDSLLAQQADVGARVDLPDDPIFWANMGNPEPMLADLWLDYPDEVRGIVNGSTPLHWSARWSPGPEVSQRLLQSGAQVNARTAAGWTPLHWAATRIFGGDEIIELLVEWGAERDARTEAGETANQIGERFADRLGGA